MTAQESNIVNAFETTLAAQLASGGTSMNLSADPGVDSPAYFVIDPDNDSNREIVLWASGTDHSAATITRDLDTKHGTDPTHASGTKVRLAVVKQHFEDIHDRVNDIALTGDVTGTLASATQDVATTIAAGAVDFAMINQGDLITQAETITSNDSDTKIPTAAAVKNYADAEAATLTNKVLQDYAETDQDVTSAAVLAIDLANGNTGSVTLAHSVTDIDFTNVPAAGIATFTLIVTQDGTGSRTMAINKTTVNGQAETAAKTAGAAGLTLSTAAASIDIVTFIFKDASTTVFIVPQLAFA